LHTLLLELVVLKLARTLLSGTDTAQQTTGDSLDRRHAWLTVGSKDRQTCIEQSAIGQLAAFIIGDAGSWAQKPIKKCH
jgi:hypothetical protein